MPAYPPPTSTPTHPLDAHRFWLWGLSGAGVVATILVGVWASYALHVSVLTVPFGLFGEVNDLTEIGHHLVHDDFARRKQKTKRDVWMCHQKLLF